ncbi:hypothetical protein PAXRUDRAFT_21790 [Paxillus rubicundulus Ve08.2h10]|uniref:CCHC-type domain-containing protein n=1 Tax=Paxillus rubicundulus Ve08.2h10 TaxID=930991 RepID=A0A0D0CP64_9AGAM|nr:hypothetical protein PAXRUDRAFT_21790 [Paxillus rubicundulus Ve08.2h10]
MYSIIAYLDLNEEVYTNDKKKIIATLSFMNKCTAGSWAEVYYEAAATSGWGTWDAFSDKFKKTFIVADVRRNALVKLTTLNQCQCGSLENTGLDTHLSSQIVNMDTVPDTLDKWIAKAEHFHVQNQQIQALKSRITFVPRSSNPAHDPNAMDVDAVKLTPLQQAEYMKKGLCFICGKQGHRSTDHKSGRPSTKVSPSSSKPTPIRAVKVPPTPTPT